MKAKEFKVLPPEDGHPIPEIGYRLMKRVVAKNGRPRYVCFMLGAKEVMVALANANNEAASLMELNTVRVQSAIPRLSEKKK